MPLESLGCCHLHNGPWLQTRPVLTSTVEIKGKGTFGCHQLRRHVRFAADQALPSSGLWPEWEQTASPGPDAQHSADEQPAMPGGATGDAAGLGQAALPVQQTPVGASQEAADGLPAQESAVLPTLADVGHAKAALPTALGGQQGRHTAASMVYAAPALRSAGSESRQRQALQHPYQSASAQVLQAGSATQRRVGGHRGRASQVCDLMNPPMWGPAGCCLMLCSLPGIRMGSMTWWLQDVGPFSCRSTSDGHQLAAQLAALFAQVPALRERALTFQGDRLCSRRSDKAGPQGQSSSQGRQSL